MAFYNPDRLFVMHCIYSGKGDVRLGQEYSAQDQGPPDQSRRSGKGLSNDPIPIYEQDVDGEMRYVYYGETEAGRLLAVVLVERGENIRVVTAYDLDAGQKRDYLARRLRGE